MFAQNKSSFWREVARLRDGIVAGLIAGGFGGLIGGVSNVLTTDPLGVAHTASIPFGWLLVLSLAHILDIVIRAALFGAAGGMLVNETLGRLGNSD